ncbi:hypothetical protein SAMN05216489_00291 [Streptomyces sp. 3213]|uniref:hypothetical protein n=1 Tax=Streptomyces sp. 3213.3 TaxID=1855348 RepID=UPI00089448AD|nr:hypothetical protein [Streptomyces sp. 3213.3]SEC26328.1 hypothetical protein SAMN05216489_00291 [Streptomyces sp. 3213] [Streptomyces sp. 3213.3]
MTVTDELRNTVAANLSRFEQGQLDPGRSIEPTDTERLRSALLACDESAHSAVVTFCAAHGPDGEDTLRTLVSLRSQFLADGYVTGEVMGVIRLRQELDPSRPAGTLVRNHLYPIARQIIDDGDEVVVQRVADALRRELAAMLRDARVAPDLETYMQALFGTVPTGHAAAHIYEALRDHGREQPRRARAGRIHRQIQEDNARVRHAFVHQATDVGGLQWHIHRHDVEARRSAGGDAAALALAERLVQLGLYPPTLIPALLGDVS